MTQCRFSILNSNTNMVYNIVDCFSDLRYRTKHSLFFLADLAVDIMGYFLFQKVHIISSTVAGERNIRTHNIFHILAKDSRINGYRRFCAEEEAQSNNLLACLSSRLNDDTDLFAGEILPRYGREGGTIFHILYIFTSISFIHRHGRFISHLPE